MLTPGDLKFILHCNTSSSAYSQIKTPSVQIALQNFADNGIVEAFGTDGVYSLTAKGRAWLRQILKTPYPEPAWVDENGNVV